LRWIESGSLLGDIVSATLRPDQDAIGSTERDTQEWLNLNNRHREGAAICIAAAVARRAIDEICAEGKIRAGSWRGDNRNDAIAIVRCSWRKEGLGAIGAVADQGLVGRAGDRRHFLIQDGDCERADVGVAAAIGCRAHDDIGSFLKNGSRRRVYHEADDGTVVSGGDTVGSSSRALAWCCGQNQIAWAEDRWSDGI